MAIDLTALQTKINTLVDEMQVDYRIGDKEVKNSQKLEALLKLRRQLADIPVLGFDVVQFDDLDIGLDGKDNTQLTVL